MARETTTLRVLTELLTPGGVLLVAAWALQREDVVRDAATPYAVYFAVGALATALLLSWYHDQSRLLSVTLAVALTVWTLHQPDHSSVAKLAAIFLLPLNFILFASLRESGVMTFEGFVKLAIVFGQAVGVAGMTGETADRVESLLRWRAGVGGSPLPLTSQLSFAIAALTLLTLVFSRRSKVEQGLLWALAAMFLGVHDMLGSHALLFYAGATGLVLMFAVLEHGYDIAYRDELTGLLGRRAFNSIMGQLGRTYAIAMCDVDHFKKFNDTYGHDAGDQALRMVATKLLQVGGGGRVFRYGGEEFLVVFRGRSAREAAPFAESVRKAIADTGFVLRGPDRPARKPSKVTRADQQTHSTISVTVSIGVAERSTRHSTPELVLDAADAALYRAKEAGRNCVKLADSTQSPSGFAGTA
jgi:diguanylate cyclase (GGDEF)-like protein